MDNPLPTPAHRLFFIKATNRTTFKLLAADYWADKVGEASATYQRCIAGGFIAPASIEQIIDLNYKKEELKPLLKERNLKLSGKKDELIARLMAADPVWCKTQTEGNQLYVRTPAGQRLADEIYDAIGREEGEMEARLLLLVHDGKYEDAFHTWAAWDEDQVFPRDEWQGIDNRETDPRQFVEMAQRIEKLLPPGKRERAILNFLYGRASYEPDMLTAHHAAAYERDLLDWREKPFISGIKFNAGKGCAFAQQHDGCYRLEDAPDYPFGLCELEMDEGFCTCGWECIFNDEQPAGGWRVPDKRHPMAGPPIRAAIPAELRGMSAEAASKMSGPEWNFDALPKVPQPAQRDTRQTKGFFAILARWLGIS